MKTMINLLPRSHRRHQMLRRRGVQWASVIALALLAGGAWHGYEMREHQLLSQQIAGLTREHGPVHALLEQLGGMRQQLEELQQQEVVARELEYQRNVLTLLGAVSDAARRTDGKLRVMKLELTDFQNLASDKQAVHGATMKLSGVALDPAAAAELLDSLQNSRLFSRVELLTIKERPGGEVAMRDYEIKCEF